MTTLAFPEAPEDLDSAFNNALGRGEFCNDPRSKQFWALHDLQACEIEGDEIVADWFVQRSIAKYIRVEREEEK